jgi:hypothetical protein
VETQFDHVTGEYILTLRHPDGSSTVERFPSAATLEARLLGLEEGLHSDRWEQRAPALPMRNTWHL